MDQRCGVLLSKSETRRKLIVKSSLLKQKNGTIQCRFFIHCTEKKRKIEGKKEKPEAMKLGFCFCLVFESG